VSGSNGAAAQLELQDKAHFNHNTRQQIKVPPAMQHQRCPCSLLTHLAS